MEYKETIIIPLLKGPMPIASYEEIKEALGDKVREYKIYAIPPKHFLGKSDILVCGKKVEIVIQGETETASFKLNLKDDLKVLTDLMEIQVIALNKENNMEKIIYREKYKELIEIPQNLIAKTLKEIKGDHLGIVITFAEARTRNEINFTETEVHISGQESQSKDYPWILIENIILKERVHWLWGFIIFGSWTCGEMLDKHPREQFSNNFSKKKKELNNYGFDIQSQRSGNEWFINYEITKSKVKCNLLEAKDNYNDAVTEFEKDNVIKAIEKLKLTISPLHYLNLKFVDAFKLLCKCIFKINYQSISEDLLDKIESFLRWYKRRLREAIFVINNIYIKKEVFPEEEIENELNKMKSDLNEIGKYYESIKGRVVLSEHTLAFEEFITLIQSLREVVEEKIIGEGKIEDVILETKEFEVLMNNKHMKDLRNIGIEIFDQYKPEQEEKGAEVDSILLEIIREGINFEERNTIPVVKKFLWKKLKKKIFETIFGISSFNKDISIDIDKVKFSKRGRRILPKQSE